MSLKIQNFTYSTNRVMRKLYWTQQVIDSEVLRRCDPLVPFKTGSLKRSGITGTKIGSGVIRYTAPYAKRQYYWGRPAGYGERGRNWFGRMKFMYHHDIRKVAQEAIKRP